MQITGPDMAAAAPGPATAPAPRAALPPTSMIDLLAATPAAEAPAPDGLQLVVPAANITVVRTAAELQRAALAGAQDIEIRAHLDLRSLERAANPAIREESSLHSDKLALLYASPPLRSIRGNCSEADAEAALGLPSGTLPDLLPLKPRQCLLLVDDSWLMVNSGSIWVDNLYVKLSCTKVQPILAFITAGFQSAGPPIGRSDIYVTATTFHGEHRGTASGIFCDINEVTVYADGCIFTDWAGFRAPIVVKFMSMASVRNSVFRNMHLLAEIVDVSFEGTINFQNVSFVNVSLEHGSIVGTTLNDYQQSFGYYVNYYAEDDEAYDMPVSIVPPGHRSLFGEQLAVLNSTMSDCLYLLGASGLPEDLPPGCPYRAAEARNRTIDQSIYPPIKAGYAYAYGNYVEWPASAPGSMREPTQFDNGAIHASFPESYSGSIAGVDYEYDYEYTKVDYIHQEASNPWLRGVTKDDHIWLERTQEALPRLAPSPGWPPFLPPLPPPQERASLQPDRTPSPAVAAAMVGPLFNQTRMQSAPPASGRRVNVMAILLIVAVEVLLAGMLLWLWIAMGSRLLRRCTQKCCMHGKASKHRKRQAAQPATDHAAGSMQHAGKGRTRRRHHDGPGSVVSNGADVPPASLFNPDYEYALPLHLALHMCAQPPQSLASTGNTRPGSTVVFAPYTIDPTQPPAPKSTQVYVSAGGAGTATDAMRKDAEADADGIEVRQAGGKVQHTGDAKVASVTRQTTEMATGMPGRRLQGQLDSFTASDLFLGRFEMLGRHHRRRGGQAVVQFAQCRRDRCEFAVKFFLDWDAFLTEAALYAAAFPGICSTGSAEVTARARAVSQLVSESRAAFMSRDVSKFLPQVEAVCDGVAGGLEDPEGRPLPPCIVMERGESLQDLCNRAEPDIFTILAVLSNVSSRIAVMHALGYVHRDIKPANVMWLPRQNRWTVIDFGCIARVGEDAPLSFTLAYAPPEVAAACQARRRSIDARPALDAWSLGVTAFELLTGAPAFDLVGHGRCKVMAMLAGDLPLPWEGELSAEVQRHLGVFREPVLQLLHRDPTRRISLDAFHASCTRTRLFSSQEPAPST